MTVVDLLSRCAEDVDVTVSVPVLDGVDPYEVRGTARHLAAALSGLYLASEVIEVGISFAPTTLHVRAHL